MTLPPNDYWRREIERRVIKLEEALPHLPVIDERLKNLSSEVKNLRWAFYVLIIAVVSAALTFGLRP